MEVKIKKLKIKINKIILTLILQKKNKKNKKIIFKKICKSHFKIKVFEKDQRARSKAERNNLKVSIERQTKICLSQ